MDKHTGDIRGFYWLSKSWYAEANLKGADYYDSISVGFYSPEGGTSGEFNILWPFLREGHSPKICAFDDAWSALWEFKDVLGKLATLDGQGPSPEEVVSILLSCGVKDMTQTKEQGK